MILFFAVCGFAGFQRDEGVGELEVNRGASRFRVACDSAGDFVTHSGQIRDSFSWRQAPRRARDGAA